MKFYLPSSRVAAYGDVNMMQKNNLGIAFGPVRTCVHGCMVELIPLISLDIVASHLGHTRDHCTACITAVRVCFVDRLFSFSLFKNSTLSRLIEELLTNFLYYFSAQ